MKEYEVHDLRYDEGLRNRVENHIMPTICCQEHGITGRPLVSERERESRMQNARIRKLTPKECIKLMGFTEDDYMKMAEVNSDSQIYKQAGNSIVVQVLEAIFKEML